MSSYTPSALKGRGYLSAQSAGRWVRPQTSHKPSSTPQGTLRPTDATRRRSSTDSEDRQLRVQALDRPGIITSDRVWALAGGIVGGVVVSAGFGIAWFRSHRRST
jgi:hypothetical protein